MAVNQEKNSYFFWLKFEKSRRSFEVFWSEFVEDNIICLCKIIETLKNKFVVETYIEKLTSIQKQKSLPKRLVFSLMDTIESIQSSDNSV